MSWLDVMRSTQDLELQQPLKRHQHATTIPPHTTTHHQHTTNMSVFYRIEQAPLVPSCVTPLPNPSWKQPHSVDWRWQVVVHTDDPHAGTFSDAGLL